MQPVRARSAVLAVLGLAAAAAGCSGGTPAPVRHGRLDVSMREFHLSPSRSQARAGQLEIVARDSGTLPHQLAIGRGRYALAITPILRPGGTATLRVRLPAGAYRLFCTLSNHDTLGLYGSLVVR